MNLTFLGIVVLVLGGLLNLFLRDRRRKAGKSAVSTASQNANYEKIRDHLLDQLQVSWLDGLLENSLYHATCQEMGIEPDVERPWNISLVRPNLPAQTLPPSTNLLFPFRELGGNLLILGQPGSGKTTTLLELACDLHQLALNDDHQPIPLVFNLSSWVGKQDHFINWLTDQLTLNYGLKPSIGYNWLDTWPYHLLLDGLDQIPAKYHKECHEAIDRFRQDYGHVNIVLTITATDYFTLTQRSPFKGTLVIQPLDDQQIDRFLAAVNPPLAQHLAKDPALSQLAQNPLYLNLLALTYPEIDPEPNTPGLINGFVNRMFGFNGGPDSAGQIQAVHHLSWLAARLRERHQNIFYLEMLQPDWLGRYKRHHTLASIALFGLGFLLISWLIITLLSGIYGNISSNLSDSLKIALLFSAMGGVIGAFTGIKPARIFEVNQTRWLVRVGIGIFLGFFLWEADRGPVEAIVSGVSLGLIFGLFGTLREKTIGLKTASNQDIHIPGRSSLKGLLFYGLSCSFIILVQSFAIPGLITDGNQLFIFILGLALTGLLAGGLFGFLRFGGSSYIKHYLLRLFLSRYNYLPYDLLPFLDDMVNSLLLRKVGGGYTFTHPLLQDYFADLENKRL